MKTLETFDSYGLKNSFMYNITFKITSTFLVYLEDAQNASRAENGDISGIS